MTVERIIKRAEDIIFGEYRYDELKKEGLIARSELFVPSLFYPPVHRYPSATEEILYEGLSMPPSLPIGIYVHFPFCIKQCVFCHYRVDTAATREDKDRYLDMLGKEMDIFMNKFGLKTIRARSILVGGGTPTYLTPGQLERFLADLTSRIIRVPGSQFSYDVDPTTLLGRDGSERLKIMKDNGVDRLTIGAQSFDDVLLKKMNRAHDSKDIFEAIKQARKAGFDKICLEFIYGYPGLTVEKWIETARTALTAGAEELHYYRLKIVPYGSGKGAIAEDYAGHAEEYPSERDTLIMKEATILMMNEGGYHENLTRVFTKTPQDVSGYARDMCCFLVDTAGFGLTAMSSYHDRHCRNMRTYEKYYSLIEKGKLPVEDGKIRTRDEQLRWALIRPLKNWWVNKSIYERTAGVSLDTVFRKKIARLKKFGLIEEDDKKLGLTPKGRFFADEVCHQFYHPDHMPFPKNEYAEGELSPYNDFEP